MADPFPSGPRRSEALEGVEDEARIEHLLVTGLDHYFAGEFEPAINLWTRVLFLDRNHDRARAYIERARSAQAEQQRASEALVHQGLEAFDRGDVTQARALLRDAIDRGASSDLALGVFGRIDRLDVSAPPILPGVSRVGIRRRRLARHLPLPSANARGRGRWLFWAMPVLVLAAVAGIIAWTAPDLSVWWPQSSAGGAPVAVPAVLPPLPIPAPTETYLAQGRALFAQGKLRDALLAIDRVPLGGALRLEADRLRSDIQRELLASVAVDAPRAPVTTAPPVSPPPE